jgi:hypothetical protein
MHSLHSAALRPCIVDTIGDGGHSGRLLQILGHQLVTDVRRQAAQKYRLGPAGNHQARTPAWHPSEPTAAGHSNPACPEVERKLPQRPLIASGQLLLQLLIWVIDLTNSIRIHGPSGLRDKSNAGSPM